MCYDGVSSIPANIGLEVIHIACKRPDLNTEDIIRRYLGGESTEALAKSLKANSETIRERLIRAGVSRRSRKDMPSPRRCKLDTEHIVRRYMAGVTELALAKELGVSRTPIRRLLLECGITPRGLSAAQRLRASTMTPAERQAQTAASHLAATGRVKTFSEMCLTAQTRQKRGVNISERERTLAAMLWDRGIEVIHQLAVGPYNCDLAADPVAVEVLGGHWHWHGYHIRTAPKRIHYLLNAGWHVLMIPVNAVSPLTPAVADYVAAYIQQARSNPAARREYRVVWRAGEFMVSGTDGDNISLKPPFTSRQNPVTGRYESVSC